MRKVVGNPDWRFLAVGTILPGVLAGVVEYTMTRGVSGWVPVVATLIGGITTISVLRFMDQRKSVESYSPSVESPRQDKPLTEDKIFTQRTPTELVNSVKGLTAVTAEDVAKRYTGLWLRTEGIIEDVRKDNINEITVIIYENEIMLFLSFDDDAWGKQARAFDIGDRISAFGKIRSIRMGYVSLEECELT